MLTQVRRWLQQRAIVLVGDSSFAALELLDALRQFPQPVQVMTRLRLDAALYHPAPEHQAKLMGHPRIVGKRLPSLKGQIDNPHTPWNKVVVQDWYGQRDLLGLAKELMPVKYAHNNADQMGS